MAKTILSRADELMAGDPSLHIVDLMNQGEYIDIIVDSVLNNLLTGGALAILILLLFLMDFRPTITVAFSIPISVVIAFVAMYFTGITLNVLSLSGLSLGIGMLVDNSIVAIENIYRLHDEEGVPLLRACVEGVRSVSGALFSSTLTTICVFLPIVFVQGMARDLFADMGLTIAYSLLASLLVAMTVVPMMCSFLMRKSRPKKHRVFSRIQAGYTALLKGALRVKPLVLLAALGLLVFAGMQVPKMGISFMPEVNSRQMSATLTPDPEASTAEQRQLALDIMDDMLAIEGVDSVGLMGGSGGMLAGLGGGQGGMSYITSSWMRALAARTPTSPRRCPRWPPGTPRTCPCRPAPWTSRCSPAAASPWRSPAAIWTSCRTSPGTWPSWPARPRAPRTSATAWRRPCRRCASWWTRRRPSTKA